MIEKFPARSRKAIWANIFWNDLINPTNEEKYQVEKDFRVEFFTKHETL